MTVFIQNVCTVLFGVDFFILLGIVGGNEKGMISNRGMAIWGIILCAIGIVLVLVINQCENRLSRRYRITRTNREKRR